MGVRVRVFIFVLSLMLASCASGGKKPAPTNQATTPSSAALPYITNMRQLTFEGRRAGEGYLSKDGRQLIFQSEREADNPFYQIYLMDLTSGKTHRVSPGQGKTTCAWIHPSGQKVLFASTHEDAELKQKTAAEWEERKAPKKKYNWSFDDAYEIYEASARGKNLKNLTKTKGYDAEGSYSPDGKWIAFASNRAAYKQKLSADDQQKFDRDPAYMMDIYIMRADGSGVKQLTDVKGYDGGPFFSPDGQRLTFRRFTEDGHSAEVYTMNIDGSDQRQITRLKAMSWAPFYHPSGDYLIFATNKEGYANFELFMVDVNGTGEAVRASSLPNFDGLPVFTPDGKGLIWTHSNEAGEAQLYRADWNDELARQNLKLAPSPAGPAKMTDATPTIEARRWVEYLASDKFGGRPTGGATEPEYSKQLAETFKALGLKPGADGSYFQKYEFTSGIELGDKNKLSLGSTSIGATVGVDWIPLSYSKNGSFESAPVVFAGYGITAPAANGQAEYNSYAGLDVKDKWVLAFAGLPENVSNEKRFHLHVYSRLQHKATVARLNGARGLILVDDSAAPAAEMKLNFEGRNDDAGLAVLRLSPALADKLFAAAGTSRAEWTQKLIKGEVVAADFSAHSQTLTAEARVDLKLVKGQSNNIVAKLEAPGAKSSVIVGAHLDHLGLGEGGTSLSKIKGAIHHGADDNASGVAGVMQVARTLAAKVKSGELKLKQNVYFGLWTGEEIGVLGSNYFAKNSVAKNKITASINMDMIGRMREALIVQGLGSAKEWKGLVEQTNFKDPMPLTTQEDPYLPSDALSFYMKGIPSIMLFTGSHPQYHTGEDTAALINYEGLVKTADWAATMTGLLASSATPLVKYVKVDGSQRQQQGRGLRLYLGTIPDYSQEGKTGVLISGTSKDSPAEKAGLVAGDTIVELGGMKIQNLNDYVYCLQALKANEKIKIRLLRAGNEKQFEITPVLKAQTH